MRCALLLLASMCVLAMAGALDNELNVLVFDDSNGDGLSNEDGSGNPEKGIRQIQVTVFRTGGADIETKTTNFQGRVTFNNLPIRPTNLQLRIENPPAGSAATLRNVPGGNFGDNTADNSVMNNQWLSSPFTMTATGTRNDINMGFLLPGSVSVRVFDDHDCDGIQDELDGYVQTPIRLTDFNTNTFGPKEAFRRDVTFTGVPQKVGFRAQLVDLPEGAVISPKNRYAPNTRAASRDSDAFPTRPYSTDRIELTKGSGENFDSVDIGICMPGRIEIRVWDDVNRDGRRQWNEPALNVPVRVTSVSGPSFSTPFRNTGSDGLHVFTGIPQQRELQVEVGNIPNGYEPTTRLAGNNPDQQNTLLPGGPPYVTDPFTLLYGSNQIITDRNIGFRTISSPGK